MRALLIVLATLVQFGQRPPLTPAETLLEPSILKAIEDAPLDFEVPPISIDGADPTAGEIVIVGVPSRGVAASWAVKKLHGLVESKRLSRPARAIRFAATAELAPRRNTKAAICVRDDTAHTLTIVRGPWSTSSLGDEVVEIFARQTSNAIDTEAFRDVGQLKWDPYGIPTTTIVTSEEADTFTQAAFVAAASAYFLATLPNSGAEALLSHLTVGAHARLAEDGRKAVAQMGNQQRAGADVLIMFAQAIEREQRRMRSFERFMPAPVDPMLHSRILDMEKGITSVWTSMAITSSPFVPAAERIRGRGGEDRRVPSRLREGLLPAPDPPTAMLKYPNVSDVIYELGNFIDGQRSISDIRDAVSAEFGPIALPVVVDYFERLAKTGAVAIR